MWFFEQVSHLLNIIGVSCKLHDMLRDIRAQEVLKALELGEIESGRGLNQEMGLARPGDTRWGSHIDQKYMIWWKPLSHLTLFSMHT